MVFAKSGWKLAAIILEYGVDNACLDLHGFGFVAVPRRCAQRT